MTIFVTVFTIETISTRIRARLRPGEHDTPSLLEHVRGLLDPYNRAGIAPETGREDRGSNSLPSGDGR